MTGFIIDGVRITLGDVDRVGYLGEKYSPYARGARCSGAANTCWGHGKVVAALTYYHPLDLDSHSC